MKKKGWIIAISCIIVIALAITTVCTIYFNVEVDLTAEFEEFYNSGDTVDYFTAYGMLFRINMADFKAVLNEALKDSIIKNDMQILPGKTGGWLNVTTNNNYINFNESDGDTKPRLNINSKSFRTNKPLIDILAENFEKEEYLVKNNT